MVGKTLGLHEILEPLGEGGMGEVYRAHSVRCVWRAASLFAVLLLPSCWGGDTSLAPLTAQVPLHLEDHLDAAIIEGSEVSADLPEPVEWRFDQPQPGWEPAHGYEFSQRLVEPVRTSDALRVVIAEEHADSDGDLCGYVYTDLPDWQLQEWADVAVEARAQPGMESVGLALNFTQSARAGTSQARGGVSPLIADGTVQTYLLSPNPVRGEFDGPWRQLILQFCASKPSTLDLLSVKVIPKEAAFASSPVGVSMEALGGLYRRTLYTHAPATLIYEVRIPDAGQLDVGLCVVRRATPVTFRVTVTPGGGEAETRFEETVTETEHWVQHRIDLSDLAGHTVSLALETDADRTGTVALWAAPTLSGARTTEKPNIIFYVIDGAGADWMSVYGYNRSTTPFLEELAREAVVFEQAYSNATWTKISTPSFMTSLMYSSLSPYRSFADQVPEGVPTMADEFGAAAYQTGVFTSNAFAATMSGLERGVDLVRVEAVEVQATSSELLHNLFVEWRETYPGQPYWAHFQTTDVHEPFRPQAPFAGLFIDPERRERYIEWDDALGEMPGWFYRPENYEALGITVEQHALAQQALYDEGMAHQDHHLRQLVAHLKASGEWGNTILVIAADHGYPAGSHRFMPGMDFEAPIVHPYATRVPLLFVAPGRIAGGRRVATPVSMIDVMPTLLDLAGLPPLEVQQGRSLAALLRGEIAELEQRPIFIEKLGLESENGSLVGTIGVIDGRWAASLLLQDQRAIPQESLPRHGDGMSAHVRRTEKLLLWDRGEDPLMARSVHEDHPDLVAYYQTMLEEQLEANAAIARLFGGGGDVELSPEQLEILRTLGYIR